MSIPLPSFISRWIIISYLLCLTSSASQADSPSRHATIDSIKTHVLPTIPAKVLPKCNFVRNSWKPLSTPTSIDVYDETGLANAIINHDNAIINIKADILLKGSKATSYEKDGTIKSLVNISRKKFIIQGNDHKIIDFCHPVRGIKMKKGKYQAPYDKEVKGDEAFITKDGEILQLSKSKVYRAKGWVKKDAKNRIYGLIMPNELRGIRHFDNVFISYRVSFVRQTYKVLSSDNHAIYFQVDSTDYFTMTDYLRNLSPKTDFFLTNFVDDGKGVMIKKGIMTYSTRQKEISQCQAKYIFRTKNDAQVEFQNLDMIGGMEYYIMNDAHIRVSECQLTNPIFGGIYNTGTLFADNNVFTDVKTSVLRTEHIPKYQPTRLPYMEVTNNKFTDIGKYSTNTHAVWSIGKSYIAHNEFVNTNYSAIAVGKHNCTNNELPTEDLVEYNYIHHTPLWIAERQQLGFQDSGDIYIRPNNGKVTIRYNTILDSGGLGKNIGIYGDDGAYNMDIYGNIILDNENFYDIDCRDGSKKGEKRYTIPDNNHLSTNNFIAYNICNGYLRMQENANDGIKKTGCNFHDNYILSPRTTKNVNDIVNQDFDYQGGKSIIHASSVSAIIKRGIDKRH